MFDFIPGQRCISDAELQMGLGTILSTEQRTITVVFMASGETRTYAKHSAPLTRVVFSVGETITRHDGLKCQVTAVTDDQGLVTYSAIDNEGNRLSIAEAELDNLIQLNRPSERLFNGQIDKDTWFELRYQTLYHKNRLARTDLYGLTGSRTSLIKHQLYVAHEVANRYAPRVLLADEVGLGKTIEAGLILHHQLLTERAQRILIVVPETLIHQWLVEMLRRFNLHFKIFDETRCNDLITENEFDNIFHAEQLVLCSLHFLVDNETVFTQCRQADWDLLVVDEAHHLQWSSDNPSIEYNIVDQLSRQTKGVLLLTATPEQLGKESHFARLRLLDPNRFHDYQQFLEEEKHYEPFARLIEDLLNDNDLSDDDIALINTTLDEDDNAKSFTKLQDSVSDNTTRHQARIELVEHLLDRHGTGRVLFRNTRSAVKGFPQRALHAYPLPLPAHYHELDGTEAEILLTPEIIYQCGQQAEHWTQIDPRIDWLTKKCAELLPHKVLVIAANANTVQDITQFLRRQTGIQCTAFHQGLSIVERDRAAASFADFETGSQVLICSEIGSEGRNFQFAHHLILFDLPLNPDLLEQRIGRLDRIGQNNTINIHVPYLEHTAQYVCFRWYSEALQAFQHTCPAGHSVYKQVYSKLVTVLLEQHNSINAYGVSDKSDAVKQANEQLESLIKISKKLYQEANLFLQRGRDRLLEYNSCRPAIASDLQHRSEQADENTEIATFMELAYDCFGIDIDIHSEGCFIIRPTEHMINAFPGLNDDGMTITYQRDIALAFEDAHYITWEHPLTNHVIDRVLSNETGNTAVTTTEYADVQKGALLLECLFSLEGTANEALQSERYLPPTMIRVVCDERGADHHQKLSHSHINQTRQFVENGVANKIVKARKKILKAMLKRSELYANRKSTVILQHSQQQASETITREVNRLEALSRVNPNVRSEEIQHFEQQLSTLTNIIDNARLRLDAIRVIVVI